MWFGQRQLSWAWRLINGPNIMALLWRHHAGWNLWQVALVFAITMSKKAASSKQSRSPGNVCWAAVVWSFRSITNGYWDWRYHDWPVSLDGMVSPWWSIAAQHGVLVERLFARMNLMRHEMAAGLLHDAPEYVTYDHPSRQCFGIPQCWR